MTDEERKALMTQRGDAAFQSVLDYFNKIGCKSFPDKKNNMIRVTVQGDDLPMDLYFRVIPISGMLEIISPLYPIQFPQDRFPEIAVALNAINSDLAGGSFYLNFSKGDIYFHISTFYVDTGLSYDEIHMMMLSALDIVDTYNDKLLALQSNVIDINTFLAKVQNGDFLK